MKEVLIYRLSREFYEKYPTESYPEILTKKSRPYNCLILEFAEGLYICIPYRTYIRHKNAYLFKKSIRSREKISGLDYSKLVIIKDKKYLESYEVQIIDDSEYKETVKNIKKIKKEVEKYLIKYVLHIKGEKILHNSMYKRLYEFSTVKYFENFLLEFEI